MWALISALYLLNSSSVFRNNPLPWTYTFDSEPRKGKLFSAKKRVTSKQHFKIFLHFCTSTARWRCISQSIPLQLFKFTPNSFHFKLFYTWITAFSWLWSLSYSFLQLSLIPSDIQLRSIFYYQKQKDNKGSRREHCIHRSRPTRDGNWWFISGVITWRWLNIVRRLRNIRLYMYMWPALK